MSSSKKVLYNLGTNIRNTRTKCGLSLTSLANEVGSDKSAVSKIEKGERMPGLEMLGKLADAMNVPMASLMRENTTSQSDTMLQFIESRSNKLDMLSPDQLVNIQMIIDQALNMAGV